MRKEIVSQIREYSENDVLALGYIWLVYMQTMSDVCGLTKEEVIKCPTTPSLTWKSIVAKIDENQIPEQYQDPLARQFIRKTIHGGRCVPYIRYMNAENTDNPEPLIATDKNSLYPDVMANEEFFSDTLGSTHMTEKQLSQDPLKTIQQLYKDDKGFSIKCDIYIPEDIGFIPVPVKKNGIEIDGVIKHKQVGCFYQTGYHEDQYYGHIDIREMLKYGIQVLKIKEGIVYNRKIVNPFKATMTKVYADRMVAKENGQNARSDCLKLFMNSGYGKTTSKEIDHEYVLMTKSDFTKKGYKDQVMDWTPLANGQMLVKMKSEPKSQFPSLIGSEILQHARAYMNKFIDLLGGTRECGVAYTDTDSLYIPVSKFKKLEELGFIGDELFQCKNDEGKGWAIIEGYFLAPKVKYLRMKNYITGEEKEDFSFKGIQKTWWQGKDKKAVFQQLYKKQQNYAYDIVDEEEEAKQMICQQEMWVRSFQEGV